ncbi:hypothetical protein [Methylorubrum aminovorans]
MISEQKPKISLDDLDAAPENLPAPRQNLPAQIDNEHLGKILRDLADATTKKCQLEEELQRERSKNTTRAILDDLIKPFADRVFAFMCGYSAIVGCFVFYHGLGLGFKLPDTVLNYLVGSTAVTVLGLVGTVLTGIFVGARK